MNKKVKKGLDIGAIVLICIIFLLGVCILSLSVTRRTDGVPRVFGVTVLDVKTDSMKGTIDPGDVAVITKVKNVKKLKWTEGGKKNDIITFWDYIDTNGDGTFEKVLNTHRIVRIEYNEEKPAESIIYTKGDNVGADDPIPKTFNEVVGVYHFRLPNFGYFIRFLQSWYGFMIVVILPLAAFLGYRIYVLVRVIQNMKKEKLVAAGEDPETLKAELEALRAKVAGLESEKGTPENSDKKNE